MEQRVGQKRKLGVHFVTSIVEGVLRTAAQLTVQLSEDVAAWVLALESGMKQNSPSYRAIIE